MIGREQLVQPKEEVINSQEANSLEPSPKPGTPPLPQVNPDIDEYEANIKNTEWIKTDFVSDPDELRELYGEASEDILISADYAFQLGREATPEMEIDRIPMPEVGDDNIRYFMDIVMNKPLHQLTPEELKWRLEQEKEQTLNNMEESKRYDLNEGLDIYKEGKYSYFADFYMNADEYTQSLIRGILYGQNSSVDYTSERIALDYAQYVWDENELERKYVKGVETSYQQEYEKAVKVLDKGFRPYFEMAITLEKKADFKFELKGDMVIATTSIKGQGEKIFSETVYFSQEAAKLLQDPEKVIMLSPNEGFTVEEIVSGSVDIAGLISEGAIALNVINATPGLGALVTMASIDFLLADKIFKADLDKALLDCKQGDYITVTSVSGCGTNYNCLVEHTNGNEVYAFSMGQYDEDFLVEYVR